VPYKNNSRPKNGGTLVALKSRHRTTTPDEKEMAMNTTKDKRVMGKKIGVARCIWSEAGAVSSRSCTRRLDCERCLFDQNMMDFFAYNLTPLPAVPKAA
jgi:hypothetical protein